MCTCRDRPMPKVQPPPHPAPGDPRRLALPRPGDLEAKRSDQPDEHLPLQEAAGRADGVTRVRYAELRTIEPTDANALAILRGELIPYDPDKVFEQARDADLMHALILVALTGFCGGRFPV